MEPVVGRHLRMERGREHAALADEDGLALQAREDLDLLPRGREARGAV